ncbi:uncharacterized protein LOC133657625 [Entelurus aequoreus]|uniref:uncharacterized protein LOC133657620 n=1 Tax=Entelurus aequoreus TaxID=161455 RepID=UPI002B1E4F1A|nr:uncharacterized protein LOC133657620 [Entelurus aequoreus]XP_061915167.1 uncharacterized protein LOC133657625 [Entelurus aequoreus]XP_061915168.1 uncharacterized protein LOC133657625 [Entelurus aequoreus]
MSACFGKTQEAEMSAKMIKRGKRHYSPKGNDAKWFPHPDVPQTEGRNRELSTSTGLMLTQVTDSLPQAFDFERFPKVRIEHKTRTYPVSDINNRLSLHDNIIVFDDGAGRRKCPQDASMHRSHFCLCHDGRKGSVKVGDSIYRADYATQPTVEDTTATRRFPRDHKTKCEKTATAPGEGDFMWFGKHNRDEEISMEVLGFANLKTSIRP